ncbi:MAG TPA: tetratricopeptide repeat protein, partial [candidate division Zixibacteria bacterium]|nr:tetratricopeptide repeat protein [candidate division Zixibacteria bacterium]
LAASIIFYLGYDRLVRRTPMPSTALYVEALRDLLDGQRVRAFGKLRQVVNEDYHNIDAYIRLGQILREGNKPDRALQIHKDLTLRAGLPPSQKMGILHQLAEDYSELKDYDMAAAAIKELISLDGNNRWAHIKLLKIQEAKQSWDEAFDTAAHILKLENNKSKKPLAFYKYQQGMQLYKQREYHKARILFKEAIGLNPAYAPAYLAVGDSYRLEERHEDAVNFWVKLIEAVPDKGHLVIDRLKKALYDLGRFSELADICHNILAHDSGNVEARLSLAEFYHAKGEIDQAETLLAEVVERSPENLKAIIGYLRLLVEKGNRRQIDRFFRQLEGRLEKPAADARTAPGGKMIGTA